MTYHTIELEIKERVAYITLNRPEVRNALNHDMVSDLLQALQDCAKDNQVKVIILKANGKVFSAGADLGSLQKLQTATYEENLEDSRHLMSLFYTMHTYPKVIIAQVKGHAIAGGSGLATICDFIFSVPTAKFGYTETRIGFVPALVSVFLTRKIGDGKARELLLTGKLIGAEQAKEYGLVNDIIEAEEIEEFTSHFAQEICKSNSSSSLALTKKLLSDLYGKDFESGLDYAAKMNAEARGTDDCKKGIEKFLNKEEIEW